MDHYIRPLLGGFAIGVLAVALFLGGSRIPPALAAEAPFETVLSSANDLSPPPFDAENLVRFGDDAYRVTTDEGVSLEPESATLVTKIGFGRVQSVSVVTTSSGTYSSDGVVSRYIRYPGVHVERVAANDLQGTDGVLPQQGWIGVRATGADSIVLITRDRSCLFTATMTVC